MKKRVLSLVLALALCLGLTTIPAAAATSGKCGDNVTWSLSGGTLTISGSGPMWDECPWSKQTDSITKAVVGKGVTTLGSCAFDFCRNMT